MINMDSLELFNDHKRKIEKFYEEQTGEELNEPNVYEKKDLAGRWLMWYYFDRGFLQNSIEDRIDGTASGAPCEIKVNTYGFNEKDKIIIDKSKIDVMPDDGRIVFIYPDYDNRILSKRQYLVGDIKKYGVLSTSGGKVDNNKCEDSNKPVYYVGHKYAEAEDIYGEKKGGNCR